MIVLLIMAVVLTIALSIVSRSVTDISLTKKEDDAARAFSVAEAGIERTLASGVAIASSGDISGGNFSTTITALASGGTEFIIPLFLSSGETAPVWLVSHGADGSLVCDASNPCYTGDTIKMCWGAQGTPAGDSLTPALELSVIYLQNNNYSSARVGRGAYDPYTTRPGGNNFTGGSDGACTIGTTTFAFSKDITLTTNLGVTKRSGSTSTAGPQMIRARLLYNTDKAHPVGIKLTDSNTSLPRQGNVIESTGITDQAQRKIQVSQTYPDLPPVFDYGLFAGTGGLVK